MNQSKYRLLLTDGLHEPGLRVLHDSELFSIEQRSSTQRAYLESELKNFDAVIVHVATAIDAALIALAQPRLKYIGCASVGYDHIDVTAAKSLGVTVESVEGGNAGSVGDLALALMLSMLRRLPECANSLRNGKWERKNLQGFALSERILGLIGAGNTGQALGVRARACGMRVLAYDPRFSPSNSLEGVDEFVSSQEELLKKVDVVSVHVPRSDDTIGLIKLNELKLLKSGSFLINTSRGKIVDESAVKNCLDEGHLAGYGVDVFDVEPLPVEHWTRNHSRVVATPHMGGATEAARTRVAVEIAKRIVGYFHSLKNNR